MAILVPGIILTCFLQSTSIENRYIREYVNRIL